MDNDNIVKFNDVKIIWFNIDLDLWNSRVYIYGNGVNKRR
jgi:hypothetical protein